MVILSNNEQTQNFYKTLGKYMRICLLNFNNDNFKYKINACNLTDDNFKFFHKDFKKNTLHGIKSIDFEILYKPNNACYFTHITCIVIINNSESGYYRFKKKKKNTSNNSFKLEFIKQI